MRSLLIILTAVVFLSQDASAQFANLSFWKQKKSSLKFTTISQNLYASNCSGVVTVGTYNSSGSPANVSSDTVVTLSSTGTVTFYSDPTCTTPVTDLTVTTGSNSGNFYFIDTAVETPIITATAPGYATVSQSETVTMNPFVWTGGGSDAQWTTAANWSGGAAPGSSDTAVFNGTCASNCSPVIGSNVNIGGLRMAGDFNGTITQGAGSIFVNGNNWVQLGGSFVGGSTSIGLTGALALVGGTFTSTSDTFTHFGNNLKISAGVTFSHNAGTFTVIIPNGGNTWSFGSGPVFNNFNLGNACGASIANSGSFTVNGTLTFDSGCGIGMSGGSINAKGNITTTRVGADGTTVLFINGSGTQVVSGDANGSMLPDTIIASTGTVQFANKIGLRNYTYTSGVIDAGTSTFLFQDALRSQTFIPGDSNNYYSVSFSGGCQNGFNLSGTLNILGTLYFTGGCPANVTGGVINLRGNMDISFEGGEGSVKVYVNGSSSQAIIGGANAAARTPYLEIANTGGTVTMTNYVSIWRGFKYTSGTVDATALNLSINDGIFPNPINPGPIEFNTVDWYGSCNGNMSLTGTMNVRGPMSMQGGCEATVTGGKMLLYGNVAMNGTGGGGSVQLEFTGSTNTTFSGTGNKPAGNITVSKTGGASLTFSNDAYFISGGQSFTVTSGSVNLNGKTLSLNALDLSGNTLTKNGGTLIVNGSTAGTGSLYNGTVNP